VDPEYTEEECDHTFERVILIDPVTRSFVSEEYVEENRQTLYAPIAWFNLGNRLEGGYLNITIVIYHITYDRGTYHLTYARGTGPYNS
jgi:hypothetical protein